MKHSLYSYMSSNYRNITYIQYVFHYASFPFASLFINTGRYLGSFLSQQTSSP
jgi:hypothetical protein